MPASTAALKKAGWTAAQLDLVEANEAFAAQACAVNQQMGWDVAKVRALCVCVLWAGVCVCACGCLCYAVVVRERREAGGRNFLVGAREVVRGARWVGFGWAMQHVQKGSARNNFCSAFTCFSNQARGFHHG